MSNVDEAKQIIDEMRRKRQALGDTTDTTRKVHYKRITKPRLARFVMFLYIFVAGMLTSALLMGKTAVILPLVIIIIAAMYSIYKE